jgi:hypothetical protein
MLRFIRSSAIAFVLAASALPLAACSGSQSVGEPTATAPTGASVAPINVVVHGRTKFVVDALAQVPLRADQRATIEQMAKDSELRGEPARKAREQLVLAVADQIQAGTIDHTALQPKIDAVAAAHETARPGDRVAFEKLHELLTPEQRVAFVTALQAEPHQGQAQGEGRGGRMHKWAAEIGLTQDQQDQIKQKLQARWQGHVATAVVGTDEQKGDAVKDGRMVWQGHKMHEQWKNTLEAFKTDKFSMDAVAPVQDGKPMAHEFAGHMLGMVEAALPVLTPDQRSAAASKLRARAANLEEDESPATTTNTNAQ